jgi:5-oxoprolinase (ATP-hydrolysing)
MGKWQFWVDRGGTFTDIVGRRPDGTLVTAKLLSENPAHYADAAVEGIARLRRDHDAPIESVKMGTTVATNALLERKGARVLLLMTEGFGDLLRIGTQARPRLFDLAIRLPELLHEQVAEIPGRLDAGGVEIAPLDDAAIRSALECAHADGIRSVAIAFMHAYLNPAHEIRAAEIARDVGFEQISPSHEASRLIKLVGRGDTAVVDAYLSPILRRYVRQVADALDLGQGGCDRLYFMQSNGGLTDAALFQGRDAILSGPAGGVVGMVRTGREAGLRQADRLRHGRHLHRRLPLRRNLRAQLRDRGRGRPDACADDAHPYGRGRRRVDPELPRRPAFRSAPKAPAPIPGPACYRKGGPLTVTDCNVMLGKLVPSHFPAVFGPNADRASRRRHRRREVRGAGGGNRRWARSPHDVAEGFLRIAVENMANAIKKISVQRGYDVTKYALASFRRRGRAACLPCRGCARG